MTVDDIKISLIIKNVIPIKNKEGKKIEAVVIKSEILNEVWFNVLVDEDYIPEYLAKSN